MWFPKSRASNKPRKNSSQNSPSSQTTPTPSIRTAQSSNGIPLQPMQQTVPSIASENTSNSPNSIFRSIASSVSSHNTPFQTAHNSTNSIALNPVNTLPPVDTPNVPHQQPSSSNAAPAAPPNPPRTFLQKSRDLRRRLFGIKNATDNRNQVGPGDQPYNQLPPRDSVEHPSHATNATGSNRLAPSIRSLATSNASSSSASSFKSAQSQVFSTSTLKLAQIANLFPYEMQYQLDDEHWRLETDETPRKYDCICQKLTIDIFPSYPPLPIIHSIFELPDLPHPELNQLNSNLHFLGCVKESEADQAHYWYQLIEVLPRAHQILNQISLLSPSKSRDYSNHREDVQEWNKRLIASIYRHLCILACDGPPIGYEGCVCEGNSLGEKLRKAINFNPLRPPAHGWPTSSPLDAIDAVWNVLLQFSQMDKPPFLSQHHKEQERFYSPPEGNTLDQAEYAPIKRIMKLYQELFQNVSVLATFLAGLDGAIIGFITANAVKIQKVADIALAFCTLALTMALGSAAIAVFLAISCSAADGPGWDKSFFNPIALSHQQIKLQPAFISYERVSRPFRHHRIAIFPLESIEAEVKRTMLLCGRVLAFSIGLSSILALSSSLLYLFSNKSMAVPASSLAFGLIWMATIAVVLATLGHSEFSKQTVKSKISTWFKECRDSYVHLYHAQGADHSYKDYVESIKRDKQDKNKIYIKLPLCIDIRINNGVPHSTPIRTTSRPSQPRKLYELSAFNNGFIIYPKSLLRPLPSDTSQTAEAQEAHDKLNAFEWMEVVIILYEEHTSAFTSISDMYYLLRETNVGLFLYQKVYNLRYLDIDAMEAIIRHISHADYADHLTKQTYGTKYDIIMYGIQFIKDTWARYAELDNGRGEYAQDNMDLAKHIDEASAELRAGYRAYSK